MTVQTVVDETQSDYTVNPANVVAVAGQPVQNVQVATVTGPANGSYSATINWGDGTSSAGEILALGGDEYSVIGSKPQPYATTGNQTITVTVSGPGDTPAPPGADDRHGDGQPVDADGHPGQPARRRHGRHHRRHHRRQPRHRQHRQGPVRLDGGHILSDNGTTILALSPQGNAVR